MTRVRFAPAPTGFLHIGGARTYIFNSFFARKNQGQVVRIDDSDVERSTDESLRSISDGLKWLDLPWDEQHQQSETAGGADRAVGRPSAFAVFATLGREHVVEGLRNA